ncbi:MAG: hypothetical protein M3N29_03305 [Chloroflexota bacterium]|nr:hypothetical protein [Chloroflexota bacterium]
MRESPRPDDIGEQRTPVAPEPPETQRSAADPRSDPGPRGLLARYPYWFVVVAVIVFALILLYLAWTAAPPPN